MKLNWKLNLVLLALNAFLAHSAWGASVSATLSASSQSVERASPVVLTWTSSGAAKCTASGGWSGGKALAGNETVQVTKTTGYTLTCESPSGPATLSWTPPTAYNDETPLVVKTYLVLSGASQAVIEGSPFKTTLVAPATSAVVQAPPGLNYFALRAVDAAGIESPNSVVKSKQIVPDASAPQVIVNFTVRPQPPTGFTVE